MGSRDSANATTVLHQMINASPSTAPSASSCGVAAKLSVQDNGGLFDHTRVVGVGVIGIRVLAGGSLYGSNERNTIACRCPVNRHGHDL